MARSLTNTLQFGQKAVGTASKPRTVVPAGQGSNALTTHGGPPPRELVKHTQGHNGTVVVNSTPA